MIRLANMTRFVTDIWHSCPGNDKGVRIRDSDHIMIRPATDLRVARPRQAVTALSVARPGMDRRFRYVRECQI